MQASDAVVVVVVVVMGMRRGREAVEAVRDGVERALMMVHWKQTSVTIVRGGLVITGSVCFHGGACAGSVGGSTEGLDCVDFTRLQAEWSGVEWSGVWQQPFSSLGGWESA